MCLTILRNSPSYSTEPTKAKIAKRDLFVVKLVTLVTNSKFASQYQDFIYEKGYIYKNDNFPATTFKRELEGEGLHSYTVSRVNQKVAERKIKDSLGYQFIECMIPKGTPYYIGVQGDIISESLQIIGKLTIDRLRSMKKTYYSKSFM